jgi:uncharacterized membrane protein YhdT
MLTWKKTTILLVIWIISTFFHNLVSGLLGVEEPVFFIVSVIIIPLYFALSAIYTLMIKIKKENGNSKKKTEKTTK